MKSDRSTKYIEVATGNGEVDFDIFFKVLDEIGFDGYNMIERNDYFDELDGMSQSINFARSTYQLKRNNDSICRKLHRI